MQQNFLEFHSLPADTAARIIDRACDLAGHWADRTMPQSLSGKRIALIVDDPGWRNTTAFQLGVEAMGGICVEAPVKLSGGEAIADLAGYLSNWFDLLIIRTADLVKLKELGSAIEIPVINARTRSNHPCETLGDLAYVRSTGGTLDGLKVAGIAPDANIIRSWIEASKSLPIKVTQVYPERWHVTDPTLLNPNFRTSTSIQDALDADVIVTDCWPKGGSEKELLPYQVSADLLNQAAEPIFLPCPPVTRGQEVTSDAMLHQTCQSRPAKAFLLHAQNALMERLTSGTDGDFGLSSGF